MDKQRLKSIQESGGRGVCGKGRGIRVSMNENGMYIYINTYIHVLNLKLKREKNSP